VTDGLGAFEEAAFTLNIVGGTPAVSRPEVLPNGHVQLQIESIYTTTCMIQISTDLREWIPLGPAVSQGDGRWTYTDEAPPQPGARFYRAIGE